MISGIEGMYYYGLRVLPENTAPSNKVFSKKLLQTQWVALKGDNAGEIEMHAISPIRYVFSLFIWAYFDKELHAKRNIKSNTRLASQNARELLERTKNTDVHQFWHLNYAAIAIWISNHWTVQEALQNLLEHSYFGYGYFGIEAAALGYYGKRPKYARNSTNNWPAQYGGMREFKELPLSLFHKKVECRKI
jgi:hypothetical protein